MENNYVFSSSYIAFLNVQLQLCVQFFVALLDRYNIFPIFVSFLIYYVVYTKMQYSSTSIFLNYRMFHLEYLSDRKKEYTVRLKMIEKMYIHYAPYKCNHNRVQFYFTYMRTPSVERREMNNFLCILKSK